MPTNQANTWPPLISQNSQDGLGQQQLYGTEVVSSRLITAENNDGFFNPVVDSHTGYAWDGSLYQNGAIVTAAPKAAWYLETPGPFRGATPGFPKEGLILVTDAGLSIIDTKDDTYTLWMLAIRGDSYGFTHNFSGDIQGFRPRGVAYQNGRVILTLSPDVGAEIQATAFLILDFVLDRIYMEQAVQA